MPVLDIPEESVLKLPTGIGGLDHVFEGGLPLGRTTLVSGGSGTAKTVFAAQFLAAGIERGEPGVFVTFEETPADIRRNVASFGWDLPAWEREERWRFVDASPAGIEGSVHVGEFDLGGLMARIEHAVRAGGASRVAIDSLGAIFAQLPDATRIRAELVRLAQALKALGVTAVLTAERPSDSGSIARYDIEEFIADNVILLRNTLEAERRRRTIEVLKFRGATHLKGQFPFAVLAGKGIVLIPLSQAGLTARSSGERIPSGNDTLDEMTGGGLFRDAITLVSGATGTGKTLLTAEYVRGGADAGDRVLLFSFEESPDQLIRNAKGWGVDFTELQEEGKLLLVCEYPGATGAEDQLIAMRDAINEFQPGRVAVDGLSAVERSLTVRSFREFVFGLTSHIRDCGLSALFTTTTPSLFGGDSITEAHISSITDSVILLRYIEVGGTMRRGVMVLKMRGSAHDRRIRDFTIGSNGMSIGGPLRGVQGIFTPGGTRQVDEEEMRRMVEMFGEEGP